ncbi:unnamed protein product [Lupinus luteus]|uniref:Uncharacterized protein n=1 Tax=Lupinus luteus TaxID=3873 RepID=A0AAV1XF51_LUPLU
MEDASGTSFSRSGEVRSHSTERRGNNHNLPVEPTPISIRAGPIDIPIIKSSVNWWNTLHQPGSISRSALRILYNGWARPKGLTNNVNVSNNVSSSFARYWGYSTLISRSRTKYGGVRGVPSHFHVAIGTEGFPNP